MLRAVLFGRLLIRCCGFGFNLFEQRFLGALSILFKRFGRCVLHGFNLGLIGGRNILDGLFGFSGVLGFIFGAANILGFRDDGGAVLSFCLVCIENDFAGFLGEFRFRSFGFGRFRFLIGRLGLVPLFALFKVAE